ncbi:hypothetical protein V520_06325 [Pseudomonas putida KG-4]|nr:hypothetical protein V520_06325 [Pseudomonas putida KG-4]
MQENTSIANAGGKKGSITAALSRTMRCHAFFEQLTTQARIDQAPAHLVHCFTQHFIAEPVSGLPTREILALENFHHRPPTIPFTGIVFQGWQKLKSQRGPKTL